MSTKIGIAQLTTANASRDGSGTVVTLYTPGTRGASISRVEFAAIANSAAGALRVYYYDGTNTRMLREVLVPATNTNATVGVWQGGVTFSPALAIEQNHLLKGSTLNGETFNVFTYGTDN